VKHYLAWYKQLIGKGYSKVYSLEYAWYNSKYYNLDGTKK